MLIANWFKVGPAVAQPHGALKSTPLSHAVGVCFPLPRWPSSYLERSNSRLSFGVEVVGPAAQELTIS